MKQLGEKESLSPVASESFRKQSHKPYRGVDFG
jgi:hypothetical protein